MTEYEHGTFEWHDAPYVDLIFQPCDCKYSESTGRRVVTEIGNVRVPGVIPETTFTRYTCTVCGAQRVRESALITASAATLERLRQEA